MIAPFGSGAFLWVFASATLGCCASVVELHIDFSKTNGAVRALHGINRGPLVAGGLIDLTEAQGALKIPFTRLHDSHWPNSDVVDIHAVFPDFTRDPGKPESYDFTRTDAYLAAVRKSGAQIVYRLGETIEHDEPKRFVHPPNDPGKWARICGGIVQHYNEGWAGGFTHNIRYWEIWNEPENRPVCWTGTDDQFLVLYTTTARLLKKQFPTLKIGGPGFGYTGEVRNNHFRAGGLLTNFLAFCQRESVPLDFLSWHCYTDDPHELPVRARGMRALLDAHGFTNTESHLNEWNYLPDNSWSPISKNRGTPESRRTSYGRMAGIEGAVFITSALIQMQDAPVTMMNLFHGETGPFGLFDVHGGAEKNYYALRAFSEFLQTSRRVEVSSGSNIAALAGLGERSDTAAILVCNRSGPPAELRIDCRKLWNGARARVRVIDSAHNFSEIAGVRFDGQVLRFNMSQPSVALVTLFL